jgi:hypothetical protein
MIILVGASWKKGQWTTEEVSILQSNISNYCKVCTIYVVECLGEKHYPYVVIILSKFSFIETVIFNEKFFS